MSLRRARVSSRTRARTLPVFCVCVASLHLQGEEHVNVNAHDLRRALAGEEIETFNRYIFRLDLDSEGTQGNTLAPQTFFQGGAPAQVFIKEASEGGTVGAKLLPSVLFVQADNTIYGTLAVQTLAGDPSPPCSRAEGEKSVLLLGGEGTRPVCGEVLTFPPSGVPGAHQFY